MPYKLPIEHKSRVNDDIAEEPILHVAPFHRLVVFGVQDNDHDEGGFETSSVYST